MIDAGKILKTAREKVKMTQSQLAEKMGYSNPQFISNWERNTCGLPARKAKLFCKITGMSPRAMEALLIAEVTGKVKKRLSASQSPYGKKSKHVPELFQTV